MTLCLFKKNYIYTHRHQKKKKKTEETAEIYYLQLFFTSKSFYSFQVFYNVCVFRL